MKETPRRSALLAVMLAALVTGCPGKEGGREGDGNDGRPRRVVFWHGMEAGVGDDVLREKIAAFNAAHPDVVIEAEVYGAADSLAPKLDAAVAGGSPPDLLWWAPVFFARYAAAGVLRPVEDFIREDRDFDRDDVYPALWEAGTYRGEVYLTPFSANTLGLYVNREALAQSGGSPPRTWNELETFAKRTTRPGRSGIQIPLGAGEWTVWTWQCFLWQAGGEFLSPGGDEPAFDGPEGVRSLALWKKLLDEGTASLSSADVGYKTDDVVAGRTAALVNGPWNHDHLKRIPGEPVVAAPLPADAVKATNVGGESLYLFKSDPATERAAWKFMKFVMTPEFQIDWALRTGYLPVSESAAADPRYREYLEKNPFVGVFSDSLAYGRVRPSVPDYAAISAAVGRHIEAALYGRYGPADALSRAAAEVRKIIARRRERSA